MHKESRSAVNVSAQQAQAFVGRIPRLHDNIVQFIAEEVFHHLLVTRINFQKIGQNSRGSVSTLQGARLKQAPHRFRGISVLGDDGL